MADSVTNNITEKELTTQANAKGWVRLNGNALNQTIAVGGKYMMDFSEAAIDPAFTYRGAWSGLWPLNEGAKNGETFGPILGDQRESIQVDLNLKLDLTGVTGAGFIETGVWKGTLAAGFFWSRVRVFPLVAAYQGGGVGAELNLIIPCFPYWNKEQSTFDDMLEGFGLVIINGFGSPIKITGFNAIIADQNNQPK